MSISNPDNVLNDCNAETIEIQLLNENILLQNLMPVTKCDTPTLTHTTLHEFLEPKPATSLYDALKISHNSTLTLTPTSLYQMYHNYPQTSETDLAYKILSNPETKKLYDKSLSRTPNELRHDRPHICVTNRQPHPPPIRDFPLALSECYRLIQQYHYNLFKLSPSQPKSDINFRLIERIFEIKALIQYLNPPEIIRPSNEIIPIDDFSEMFQLCLCLPFSEHELNNRLQQYIEVLSQLQSTPEGILLMNKLTKPLNSGISDYQQETQRLMYLKPEDYIIRPEHDGRLNPLSYIRLGQYQTDHPNFQIQSPQPQTIKPITFYDRLKACGGRKAIFSRFHYTPEFPYISKLDTIDRNRFSKVYNVAGPLKFIMGRPYRNYQAKDGNWTYPSHFPEPNDDRCVRLASDRCDEPITLPSKNVLIIPQSKEVIRPSKCFDSVYKQCRQRIDPLLIQVKDKHVYD